MLQHNVILRFSKIGINTDIIHLETTIFVLQCFYLDPIYRSEKDVGLHLKIMSPTWDIGDVLPFDTAF